MSFWVQTGRPALQDVDVVADNLADAITMLYPLDTDQLILSWNLVPIALSYCEDVQVMVDDIVVLLEQLRDPATESARVYWGSSTFRAEWRLRREGPNLVVESRWESTSGSYEFLLNDRSPLTVDTVAFTREWLKVLRRLVEDVAAKSVALDNADMLLRARALLTAAESPGAEAPGAPGTPSEAGGATVRFQLSAANAGNAAAANLWRAEPAVARLFTGEARLVADALGVPSGIGEPEGDRCTVDLPAFSTFCATAVEGYANQPGIQRALTVGFVATALALLDRAGHPLPPAPSAEQQAAWSALRDQHAAVMPR
ncbi:DUF6086 family protein [Actinacidiphila acidipaludis]|uniref:DUF6086 family protein n=1 Tax=Actinacidiphila acidipaludis TaxID=2873382 RepID=A0ABS7QBL0_9ACTN|nr:DUF6086 family protein [Streptomyces acidipaludis]MBY8880539.1 DUF6086 family protein [Streptomyces acidipaludis]